MNPAEQEKLYIEMAKAALEATQAMRTVKWSGSEGPCQTQEPLTEEQKIQAIRKQYDPLLTVLLDCREVLDGIIGTEGPLPHIHKSHILRGTDVLTNFDKVLKLFWNREV